MTFTLRQLATRYNLRLADLPGAWRPYAIALADTRFHVFLPRLISGTLRDVEEPPDLARVLSFLRDALPRDALTDPPDDLYLYRCTRD